MMLLARLPATPALCNHADRRRPIDATAVQPLLELCCVSACARDALGCFKGHIRLHRGDTIRIRKKDVQRCAKLRPHDVDTH
jgi:hypothetical protein